MHYLIMEEIT